MMSKGSMRSGIGLLLAVFFIIGAPRQASAVPDMNGTWTIIATITQWGCVDPDFNGTIGVSGAMQFYQTGASLLGFGSIILQNFRSGRVWVDGLGVSLTVTNTSMNGFLGALSVDGYLGNGSLTSSVGSSFTFTTSGRDASGRIGCQWSGSGSGFPMML